MNKLCNHVATRLTVGSLPLLLFAASPTVCNLWPNEAAEALDVPELEQQGPGLLFVCAGHGAARLNGYAQEP